MMRGIAKKLSMVTRYHDLEPRKATIITEALQESVIYMIQVVHTYDSAEDMVEGIREFMLEWSETAEGQEALAMAEGCFDWSAFVDSMDLLRGKIPGILDMTVVYPSEEPNVPIIVDHDDALMGDRFDDL